jgi:hypothetical protein
MNTKSKSNIIVYKMILDDHSAWFIVHHDLEDDDDGAKVQIKRIYSDKGEHDDYVNIYMARTLWKEFKKEGWLEVGN